MLIKLIGGVIMYIGIERRSERRSERQITKLNIQYKNLGLERRLAYDRRQTNSSWLIISQAAS